MAVLAISQLIQVILHCLTGIFTITRTSGPEIINKVKNIYLLTFF